MSKKEINEIMIALNELKLDFKAHQEEVEPLLELLRGAVVGRRVILFMTSIIMAVVGAYIAIAALLK